jgi:hypothetical protein
MMTTCVLINESGAGSVAGLDWFRQNTTRLGIAGEIVLSPPLREQVFAQSRLG